MKFVFKVPEVKIVKGRREYVLKKCRNKRVLHLGCVDEGLVSERIKGEKFLHGLLKSVASELWGVDISHEGIEYLRKLGFNNLIVGDVEHIDSIKELKNRNFDVIVASEIIEHLNNPGLFLQSVKHLFTPKAIMILTTPNAYRLDQFFYSLKGLEFSHPEHTFNFTWKTLSTLLLKNGYYIEEILTYTHKDVEAPIFKNPLKKLHTVRKKKEQERNILLILLKEVRRIKRRVKKKMDILLRRYLYHKNPFFADGLIFVVKPKELKK